MKRQSLADFVINEAGRGRPRKETPADRNPEKTVGKEAEKNGSGGKWAIDEPTDDEVVEPLKKEELNKNMKRLLMKFKADEPFFILGEAGWGKTSIIKSMAKRFKRSVITVYLDKCEATDLGGIPVPRQNDKGSVYQDTAMPGWASYMQEHPEKQFLLFFDEMNQAAPDVMNALMPIVLETTVCGIKFDNFMVGAAGNFEHENDAVSELSGPLKSRFKPIIVWETGGDEEWGQAFKYMHKEWDEKLGPEIIDVIYENRNLFVNPREIEHKVLKHLFAMKNDSEKELFDTEDYFDRLESLAKDNLTRAEQDQLKKLAEKVFNYINDVKPQEDERKKRKKDADMLTDNIKSAIKRAMTVGYLTNDSDASDKRKYGISRENIAKVLGDDESFEDGQALNAEMVERYVRKLEADGIKFKYETNKEFLDAGLSDPFEN